MRAYGPEHRWFAWRPVDTTDQGWKWLQRVWRKREYLDIPGHPAMRFWRYNAEPTQADRESA